MSVVSASWVGSAFVFGAMFGVLSAMGSGVVVGAVAGEGDASILETVSTVLPKAEGLPDVDAGVPDALLAARETFPHRVLVWACEGPYRLREALRSVTAANKAAPPPLDPKFKGNILLLRGAIHLELRDLYEAETLLEKALEIFEKQANDSVGGAVAQGFIGRLAIERNRPERAVESLKAALDALADTDQKRLEAVFQSWLAEVALRRDLLDEAVQGYEKALEIARAADDAVWEGVTLRQLGIAYLVRNEVAQGAGKIEAAVVVHRSSGHSLLQAGALRLRAVAHLVEGDFNNARIAMRRAMKLEPPMSGTFPPDETSEARVWLLYQMRGDYSKVLAYVDRAIACAQEGGDRLLHAHLLAYKADLWLAMGHVTSALELFRAARELYEALDEPRREVMAIRGELTCLYWMGAFDEMNATATRFLSEERLLSDDYAHLSLLRGYAGLANRLRDWETGLARLEEALALARERADKTLEGDLLELIGERRSKAGQKELALGALEASLDIFEKLEDPQWQIRLLKELEPVYKSMERKGEAKKVAKSAKAFEAFSWAPLLRPPPLPLATTIEMVRWNMTMARFGDKRSLGRASAYEPKTEVQTSYSSWNDLLGDLEDVIAELKAGEAKHGVVEPMDTMVKVLFALEADDKAFEAREEQLVMAREIDHAWLEKKFLENAVGEYAEKGRFDRALELAGQALALSEESGNMWHAAELQALLADTLVEKEAFSEAIEAGREAVARADALGDPQLRFDALAVTSAAHRGAAQTDEAEKAHALAMELEPSIDVEDDDIQLLGEMSHAYRRLGEYDKAIEALEKALDALPKDAKRGREMIKDEIKELKGEARETEG